MSNKEKKNKEKVKETEKNDKKQEKTEKVEKKKKSKKTKIILGLIVIIIAVIFISLYCILKTDTEKAYLNSFSGNVEIFRGEYQKLNPEKGMELKIRDRIKTNSGKAIIILYEKAVLTIDENTEVEIKELLERHIVVKQENGRLWSKFLGVTGLDIFEVETPNAVATVRGTEFATDLRNESSCVIIVAEGNVNFGNENGNVSVGKLEKYRMINDSLIKEELTKEELEEIIGSKRKTIDNLKELRKNEIEKNKFLLNRVKSMYSLSDEDIKMYIEMIDRGEINPEDYLDKIPFETDSIEKILNINKKIRNSESEIKEIESKINQNE